MRRGGPSFETIHSEGALLPPDVLQRIAERDKDLGGLRGEDYGLPPNEPLNEVIVRSYNRMMGAWGSFQEARAKLPEADLGTSSTRDRLLLVLLHELGYGRVETEHAIEIEGRSFAVSHAWRNVPIHLLGCNVPIGARSKGVAGASSQSPHGILQELLNRSEERLWGIVSNGLELRLLRDNSSLTRQAFVSFDLEQMLEGDVFSDFALLWMVCHASRVEGERPYECWLERWSQEAEKQGTRALEGLRTGVEEAISALGSGFLRPGRNAELKSALRAGDLSAQDYYRELLRLVYRLLFLFVAEDRKLLHHPEASEEAKERYAEWYSSARLRRLAERRRGTKHGDLWDSLSLVMRSLGKDEGEPALGLPALGSFLWSQDAIAHVESASLPNRALLEAIRSLSTLRDGKVLRSVDYKNLGAEELGSVYESLLELHPELDVDSGTFALTTAAGNERKATGSYYTPTSLISVLLDSALDPVLDEAAAKGEEGILNLKVVDPACGSGHFLVAAAHRIAKRLAALRTGDEEPSPEATRFALRDVVSQCLYGVDVNPMAVELCKVSLWMEALDPGRPLSFLDTHVKCGNSLLGTTLALLNEGIPDEAFKPLRGDDKELVKALRKQNTAERKGQLTFDDLTGGVDSLEKETEALDSASDDTPDALREKERRFAELTASESYEHARLAMDAWCAAFVQPKVPDMPRVTTGVIRRIASGDASSEVVEDIYRLARDYGFFQWEVEYPQVFGADGGGFDVVIGNPPWERVKLQEREFFASHLEIFGARNAAARKRLIAALEVDDHALYMTWIDAIRKSEGESHLLRNTGRYPLCGRGDVNTYAVFAELMSGLTSLTGRGGWIVPTGIATDNTTKDFFASLVNDRRLAYLFDFKNHDRLFYDVGHRRFKFCLMIITGPGGSERDPEFVFFAREVADVFDPERRFSLTAEDFALFNPNTGTCPVFLRERDALLSRRVYEQIPILINELTNDNPWGLRFLRMFDMANDSSLFIPDDEIHNDGSAQSVVTSVDRYVPLYEGKMISHFEHRYGDYRLRPQGSQDTELPRPSEADLRRGDYELTPRYFVPKHEVEQRLKDKWRDGWLMGWRDISRNDNERTVIAAAIPRYGTSGLQLLLIDAVEQALSLLGCINSFVFDYLARHKVAGTHLAHFVMKQVPVLPPELYDGPTRWDSGGTLSSWLRPRVLELTYTGFDLSAIGARFGSDQPYVWDSTRRQLLRAELDAAFFHLYELEHDDVDYVMDTFPIVRRKDEEAHGEYSTKRLILEIYDELAEAIATGQPY